MRMSREETEILQQLSRYPEISPKTSSMDALASYWRGKNRGRDELHRALENLEANGFVELQENGEPMITEKGNAALASV